MRRLSGLLAFAGIALFGLAPAGAADPDALWKIISQRCLPKAEQHLPPTPCAMVDLSGGVAHGHVVLKDLVGVTQFLLMPTAKVDGIESPEILAPDAPNLFAAAWSERGRMDLLGLRAFPRDSVSLAVNSMIGRTQNQLHIHIDCVAAEVRDAIRVHLPAVGAQWAPFPVLLAGHRYQAMRLDGENLAADPFHLLAEQLPGAAADMAHQSLVAVGAVLPDGRPGFVLLATRADLIAGNFASGEELQDHACRGV